MKLKSTILLLIFFPFFLLSDETLNSSRLFIEKLGDKVISNVADPKLNENIRANNFKELYVSSFDIKYISKFVLGRHWKKLDNKTREKFYDTFTDYIVLVYAPKFKGWKGKFSTIEANKVQANMIMVQMNLINKQTAPTLKLDWRISFNKYNKFKILDVNIDGVSMLVTQRAEFNSVIKNNPKGVIGLIELMDKKNKS